MTGITENPSSCDCTSMCNPHFTNLCAYIAFVALVYYIQISSQKHMELQQFLLINQCVNVNLSSKAQSQIPQLAQKKV